MGVFAVDAEFRNDFVAEVCGYAVRYGCGVLYRVEGVHAVGEFSFEREFELEVFFDADVAGIHLVVAGGEHGAELRNAAFPAEFESVVGVVAHPEAACGEVLIDVGSEMGRLRPVGFPVTDFEVELVVFVQRPFVIDPVEVGENFVVARGLAVAVLDFVAELRGENAQHDESVDAFALVLCADIGTDPERAEVGTVVGYHLGGLGLDVGLEADFCICGKCGCSHAGY